MYDYPKLSETATFHRYDNGGGQEEYVLTGTSGRQFKVSAVARRILSRLDGETHIEQVAADLRADSVPITSDQLRALLAQRYAQLGVIEDGRAPSPDTPVSTKRTVRSPGFPMLLTWDLVPQSIVVRLATWLRILYAPIAVAALLVLISWSHIVVYTIELEAASLSPESYLRIIGLCLLSILFHELGHAAAVSRFNGTPGRIGCGLYILIPTFYADVSQIWRFPRAQRMVVDLGGAYFQQIAFACFALAAVASGSPELVATCRLIDLMVLTALNPLFHFDGYWFLADWLAIPKLQNVAFRSLAARARRVLGLTAEPPRIPPLGRLARGVFFSYSILAGLFLAATFWLVWQYLRSTLLRFPVVAPDAFHEVVAAFNAADGSLFLMRVLALFFLAAFPMTALVGLVLFLVRLVRFCAGRLWRSAGRVPEDSLSRRLT